MQALLISSLVTALENLVVFSALPVLWWWVRHRREGGFFRWVGLYRPQLQSSVWVLAAFAVGYGFFYNFDFTRLADPETLAYLESSAQVSANVYAGMGAAAIPAALVESFAANGLAEEILFRGFLCRRLCARFGSMPGILMQGVLFGLMHNLLYLAAGMQVGLWYHLLVFGFTGMGALLLGWLDQRIFNGSIWPSVLLHGAGNFLSSMLVAFG